MEDFQHVGYSKEVIEFVAVAKEFCDFVETAPQMATQGFYPAFAEVYSFDLFEGLLAAGE